METEEKKIESIDVKTPNTIDEKGSKNTEVNENKQENHMSDDNVLFESNEKRHPTINTSINSIIKPVKPNYLLWIIYLSVIFVVIYNLYINQETDPTKIGILIIGSIIIVYFAKKIMTRNTYKIEDDDNGYNLIEG
jgi:hypothetical protein